MRYRHIYDPTAFAEYKEAVEWYRHRSLVAAENFVKEFTDMVATICKDPGRFRNLHSIFRETSLKKYPYTVIYFVDEENKKVIIVSVYHSKRDPQKKYRKQ